MDGNKSGDIRKCMTSYYIILCVSGHHIRPAIKVWSLVLVAIIGAQNSHLDHSIRCSWQTMWLVTLWWRKIFAAKLEDLGGVFKKSASHVEPIRDYIPEKSPHEKSSLKPAHTLPLSKVCLLQPRNRLTTTIVGPDFAEY
jgi:hypothetical protein